MWVAGRVRVTVLVTRYGLNEPTGEPSPAIRRAGDSPGHSMAE